MSSVTKLFSRLKGQIRGGITRSLLWRLWSPENADFIKFRPQLPQKILVSSAPTERSALQCTVEGIVFWIKFYHQVIVTTPTENMFASVCPVSISPVIHVNSASIAWTAMVRRFISFTVLFQWSQADWFGEAGCALMPLQLNSSFTFDWERRS